MWRAAWLPSPTLLSFPSWWWLLLSKWLFLRIGIPASTFSAAPQSGVVHPKNTTLFLFLKHVPNFHVKEKFRQDLVCVLTIINDIYTIIFYKLFSSLASTLQHTGWGNWATEVLILEHKLPWAFLSRFLHLLETNLENKLFWNRV